MRRAMTGIAVALVVLALLGVGLRFYMERAAENGLLPGEAVGIRELRPPLPGNAALACPPGYCAVVDALPSPVFAVPAERLRECWSAAIAGEPRVTPLAAAGGPERVVAIQRSSLLRFPDIVTAEFVALAADRSSLAIYSRARYGKSDFGVNRRRIEAWLMRLRECTGAPVSG